MHYTYNFTAGGYGAGVDATYSPGTGTEAIGVGVMTPQAGFSWGNQLET